MSISVSLVLLLLGVYAASDSHALLLTTSTLGSKPASSKSALLRSSSSSSLVKRSTVAVLGSDSSIDGVSASTSDSMVDTSTSATAKASSSSGLDLGHIWTVAVRSGSSGAVAGAVQVLALMWLKTAANYQYRYGMDIRQAFRELWAQGGVRRFYQGISYALIQGPLSRFGGSFSNELARELCEGVLGLHGTVFVGTLLGSIFSTMWRLVLMPIDTCKTVLQVEGAAGIDKMFQSIWSGRTVSPLYRGTAATLATNLVSYFPWFFVYNTLNTALKPPEKGAAKLLRSAFIGFAASVASDFVSNSVRVLKVMKQTSHTSMTYPLLLRQVLQRGRGGIAELMLRGLALRVVTNGLQSVLFVVIWRALVENSLNNYNQNNNNNNSSTSSSNN